MQAPVSPQVIDKSIPTAGLLAQGDLRPERRTCSAPKKPPGFLPRAFGRLLVCGGASFFLLFDGLVSSFASSFPEPMLSLNP
jgi:hypothetical protein